jgi:hypothetical protein
VQSWKWNGEVYYKIINVIAMAGFHLHRFGEELPLMVRRVKLPVLRGKSEGDNKYRQK